MLLDGDFLLSQLNHLGNIGLEPGRGLHRLAFSPDELRAPLDCGTNDGFGACTTVDAAGNVIGHRPGATRCLRLWLGLHTDSVPGGGKYDGGLGVLAALACVRTLREEGIELRHPLLVIDFAAEEATIGPSPMGSLSMAGLLTEEMFEQPAWNGTSTRTLIESAALNVSEIVSNRPPCDLAAFLELHIEQGDHLDTEGIEIGVVSGIVGIRRYFVTFTGQANHAGTTSMARRRDALVAAAPFITAVHDVASAHGIVGTIGYLQVYPGASNVIPGRVEIDLETRALDSEVLDLVEEELARLATAGGASFVPGVAIAPCPADPEIMATITTVGQALGLSLCTMPSGAGHDAMNMATLCPYGMIFVPSIGGVSHSPDERTADGDCVNGARMLLATLLKLDHDLDAVAL
ncbi:MAG: M20 family metallo-hydrolase [Anaerolineales bacterium]|nr:M20 family metallo-hydrolase [Anaerolineales bacterium]